MYIYIYIYVGVNLDRLESVFNRLPSIYFI